MFARGFVNVLVAGTAKLNINSAEGLTLWLDGKPIDSLTAAINLDKGRRTFTFGFRPAQRAGGLRAELQAIDEMVRFQPEGGL